MPILLQPWQFPVLILAAWINRQQQEAIETPEPKTRCLTRS